MCLNSRAHAVFKEAFDCAVETAITSMRFIATVSLQAARRRKRATDRNGIVEEKKIEF